MARSVVSQVHDALVRAATERDLIEMAAIDRLLSLVEPAVHADSGRGTGRRATEGARRSARERRPRRFRAILCPVDFSEPSKVALRYAYAIAARGHGRLTVINVLDPLLVAAASAALRDRTLATRTHDELRRFVGSVLRRRPGDGQALPIRSAVRVGKPTGEIVRATRQYRSELIVMGTHGLSGAEKLLVGSTTAGVLRETKVPVLAIPRRLAVGKTRGERGWADGCMMAAIDLDRHPARDVRLVAGIARSLQCSLVLVHVLPRIWLPPWLRKTIRMGNRRRIARARRRLRTLASGVKDLRVEVRVLVGDVADALGPLAASEHAGLVVTVLRADRKWFGARRGSASSRVVSKINIPVLAWPAD